MGHTGFAGGPTRCAGLPSAIGDHLKYRWTHSNQKEAVRQGLSEADDASGLERLGVVTAASDIRIWDSNTGEELCRFDAEKREIYPVASSADGSQCLTGSGAEDGLVRLWDTATVRQVREFGGQADFLWWMPAHESCFLACVLSETDQCENDIGKASDEAINHEIKQVP